MGFGIRDLGFIRGVIIPRLFLGAVLIFSAGCATVSVGPVPPQEGIYPAATAPDAPLVLAIPGLRIPGLPVTQEQHFGHLVEMLAAEGIPCRILTYDTRENPLARGAALFSSDMAIVWTRVGPAAVHELQLENERRKALRLPPVGRVVFIGYSQGAVIMEQIATRIFYSFKTNHDEMDRRFGVEWQALKNDPEFLYFMTALEDYLVLKNIRVQREKELNRDPDFKYVYRRAEMRVNSQFGEFMRYLGDPAVRYPAVTRFEPPETGKYPKRYRKIRACAEYEKECSLEQRERIKGFFMDYAEYRAFLDVKPSFAAAAGSFFGSPRANESFALFRWFPPLKLLAGRQLVQIRQTQLGSGYQWKSVERLVRMSKEERYPIDPDNTLFIAGANGDHGDGLVDQSSAHLSDHSLETRRVSPGEGGAARGEAKVVEEARLPDLVVVPLRLAHFPEKVLWGLGGRRYGAAYMEKGNPAWPYLLSFIRGDWADIERRLAAAGRRRGQGFAFMPGRASDAPQKLRQFMLQVSFADDEQRRPVIAVKGRSSNVRIDRFYSNTESRTWVWTGHFEGSGQEMNLFGRETVQGMVDLGMLFRRGGRLSLPCRVYPGCISFIKLENTP